MWKALFNPQTLDTLPVADNAKGVVTMRQAVISYVCGTGRRRAVAKSKKKKGQVVSEKAAGQQKAPVKKKASKQTQKSAVQ
jgi:hypothetical protein